jgi:uncharacterized protein (DUF3084 family)
MITESDARGVTTKDLEAFDKAIAGHEGFGVFLYTTRRILSEIGDLDKQHRGLKQGIEHLQAQSADVARQWEHAKAELATVQQQHQEVQKQVAELNRELEQKQQALDHYSKTIGRITGAAA